MHMLSRRDLLAMMAVGCTTLEWDRIAAAEQPETVPSKASYRVQVGHNRWLGVVEYGDPLGFPVFYFHGLPACRLEAAILSDHARKDHCRLIAVDRPGFGLSSRHPGRTILSWADDVSKLADTVIEEKDSQRSFSILGFSSGGPYAVACAHRLGSTGLIRATIVSGVKSPQFTRVSDGNGGHLLALMRRHPKLARKLITVFANRCRRRPAIAVDRMTKKMACVDQQLLRSREYRDAFLLAVHESTRQGPCGILEDAMLLTSCWNIPLGEIAVPVSIWHGACDQTIPVAASHKLAEKIPTSHLTIVANEGHVSLLRTSGQEMLSWLSTGETESHAS